MPVKNHCCYIECVSFIVRIASTCNYGINIEALEVACTHMDDQSVTEQESLNNLHYDIQGVYQTVITLGDRWCL